MVTRRPSKSEAGAPAALPPPASVVPVLRDLVVWGGGTHVRGLLRRRQVLAAQRTDKQRERPLPGSHPVTTLW